MPGLLEASALTVVRGRRTVLSGVSLDLAGGAAVHLAGENGSGKTSLLRVLAGLAAPRAGRLVRHGTCAFVPEKVVLASAMRPGEWLIAMRRLRGLAGVDWPAAATASGLEADVLDRSSATLSKGMLQRIALLEALHSPCPLLLLDEPFAGLDPDGRDWVAHRLRERLAGGAAVLLTDHSGAAHDRLALTAELRLHAGAIECTADAPQAGTARPAASPQTDTARAAAAPGADDGDAAGGSRVIVAASHPDGRRLERSVLAGEGDDLLRELLAGGWHIEAVRR